MKIEVQKDASRLTDDRGPFSSVHQNKGLLPKNPKKKVTYLLTLSW